jgi:hypothetical protein
MLPLLFFAAFFITMRILINQNHISQLSDQIAKQSILLRQNQAILNNISALEGKIGSFSQTQAILDSAAVGTGVWSNILDNISHYTGLRKSIWITKLTKDDLGNISLEGYSLNKNVLTEFAFSIKTAELKSVSFEALREKNAYKFNLIFKTSGFQPGSTNIQQNSE